MQGYYKKTSNWQAIYPIGSIYMSINATDPAILFGGTWEQLSDKFIYAASDTHNAGTTGGNSVINVNHIHTTNNHTITANQMPSHYHTQWHWGGPTGSQFGVNAWGTHGSSVTQGTWKVDYSGSASEAYFYTGYTGGGAAHNHGNTGSAGSSSQSIMPPYLAVYMWKRTA